MHVGKVLCAVAALYLLFMLCACSSNIRQSGVADSLSTTPDQFGSSSQANIPEVSLSTSPGILANLPRDSSTLDIVSTSTASIPEGISVEDPVDAESMKAERNTEMLTGAELKTNGTITTTRTDDELVEESATNGTIVAEQTYDEPVSVTFMGEILTAPGSYSGVPSLYIPVIDDLYLYTKIILRYDTLDDESKITQETQREMRSLQRDLELRGYIPYFGGVRASAGYALYDLDSDGNPELLVLDNYSYDGIPKIFPAVRSVYSIRNGRLVCIDNGSNAIDNNTVLATDKIFYKCIDYNIAAGYANLKAFCLEPGMTEFTVISDTLAALSFSEGDIPVPYWMKIVNGVEINISEDEFDILHEQYKNPAEIMILDFVPFHPDADNQISQARPVDELPTTLTTLTEYPESYQGAPIEYKPILDALYHFSEFQRRDEEIDEPTRTSLWRVLGFVEWPHSDVGYAVVDINNDGVQELLLGTFDNAYNSQEEFNPSSIFTLKSGQPVLLRSFWSRSRGVILDDGLIYSDGSDGAAYTYLSSYRLDNNADILTQLTDIRSDYSISDDKPYYFQVLDGKTHYISEEDFFGFCDMYRYPQNRMKLTFIPIAN